MEQSLKLPDAKSSEDGVRTMHDVWKTVFDTYKAQSETQLQEFQTFAEKSFEMARKPNA